MSCCLSAPSTSGEEETGLCWPARVCECEREKERESARERKREIEASVTPPRGGKVGVCVRDHQRQASAARTHPCERESERDTAGGLASRRASMMRGCSGRTRLAQNQDRAGKQRGGGWGTAREWEAACRRKHERVCARLRRRRDLSPTFTRTGEGARLSVCLPCCCLQQRSFIVCEGLGAMLGQTCSLSEGAWRGGKLEACSSCCPHPRTPRTC